MNGCLAFTANQVFTFWKTRHCNPYSQWVVTYTHILIAFCWTPFVNKYNLAWIRIAELGCKRHIVYASSRGWGAYGFLYTPPHNSVAYYIYIVVQQELLPLLRTNDEEPLQDICSLAQREYSGGEPFRSFEGKLQFVLHWNYRWTWAVAFRSWSKLSHSAGVFRFCVLIWPIIKTGWTHQVWRWKTWWFEIHPLSSATTLTAICSSNLHHSFQRQKRFWTPSCYKPTWIRGHRNILMGEGVSLCGTSPDRLLNSSTESELWFSKKM